MPIVKSEELKALETSELRFRRLFETARDGILLVAADTGIITVIDTETNWACDCP